MGDWHSLTDDPAIVLITTTEQFMSTLIQPNQNYDWEQTTSVSLSESDWLQVKCFIITAVRKEETPILREYGLKLRSLIDNQLKHGLSSDVSEGAGI